MTEDAPKTYPWSHRFGDVDVTLRKITAADHDLILAFSRALPEDHRVLWGNVAAGACRGGIGPGL